MDYCHRKRRGSLGLVVTIVAGLASAASLEATVVSTRDEPPAQDESQTLRMSAEVDKTAVNVGSSLTLTITLGGDLGQAQVEPFQFPEGLHVVAQSRASNVALRLGQMQRSVSLVYVLLAREPGTFQLGPFQVTHQGRPILSDPITITVSKPSLPPQLDRDRRPRITL